MITPDERRVIYHCIVIWILNLDCKLRTSGALIVRVIEHLSAKRETLVQYDPVIGVREQKCLMLNNEYAPLFLSELSVHWQEVCY